jgi:hypothetical protein
MVGRSNLAGGLEHRSADSAVIGRAGGVNAMRRDDFQDGGC